MNASIERLTVRSLLKKAADTYPDLCALQNGSEEITYKQLYNTLMINASRLCAQVEGNRIGIQSNQKRMTQPVVISILSVMLAGKCALLLPEFQSLSDALSSCTLYHVDTLLTDHVDDQSRLISYLPLGMLPESLSIDVLPDVSPDDECMVLFTSGTTALPKGAVISNDNLCSDAIAGSMLYPFEPGMRFVNCLPYYHGYGILCDIIAPLSNGSTLCTATENGFIRDIQHYAPTNINGVPELAHTLLQMLENFGPLPGTERLKRILCGGAALDPSLCSAMRSHGIELYNCYGLTEFSTAIAVNSPEDNDPTSVGTILSCCEVTVAEDDEVLVRGRNMMKGYGPDGPWLNRDTWFHTGDLGYVNEHNHLFIMGRKDNAMLLPNGEKVQAEQYEALLCRFDCIKEAIVYLPQGRSSIAAVIVTEDEMRARTALDEVNTHLADGCRIMNPVYTEKPLRRNSMGKLIRSSYK